MSKRKKSVDEKIEKYYKKIKDLEAKRRRRSLSRHSRSPYNNEENCYETDADTAPTKRREENWDNNSHQGDSGEFQQDAELPVAGNSVQPQSGQDQDVVEVEVDPSEVTLDRETLEALGKPYKEKQKYGPNINGDLAKLWTPILKNGLGDYKEKQQMLERYLVPNNCQLLQAPKLNPEIVATVTDSIRNRDKKIEEEQQQLGQGLTALNRALSLFATNTGERVTIINTLSEAAQILSDLHYSQTQTRKRLITPILDKKFLDLVKETDREKYLYGSDLSEKLKAMKYAQKSSQSIKKNTDNFKQFKKPVYSQVVNYKGPPRYQQPRPYNRSGPKRPFERTPQYKQQQKRNTKPEVKTSARK